MFNRKKLKEISDEVSQIKLALISLRHDYLEKNEELEGHRRSWMKRSFESKVSVEKAKAKLLELGYKLDSFGNYIKK